MCERRRPDRLVDCNSRVGTGGPSDEIDLYRAPPTQPDENEFVCIEGFKDAEAGGYHVKQPYVKAFFDAAPDLVSAQPQIIYIDTPHEGFGPMGEIQPR
jgi:hypothetical protein